MAEYPERCPRCLSKYPDIHGVIFYENCNQMCDNVWHRGKDYPDKLNLTVSDKLYLKELLIRAD